MEGGNAMSKSCTIRSKNKKRTKKLLKILTSFLTLKLVITIPSINIHLSEEGYFVILVAFILLAFCYISK